MAQLGVRGSLECPGLAVGSGLQGRARQLTSAPLCCKALCIATVCGIFVTGHAVKLMSPEQQARVKPAYQLHTVAAFVARAGGKANTGCMCIGASASSSTAASPGASCASVIPSWAAEDLAQQPMATLIIPGLPSSPSNLYPASDR